MNKPTNYLLRSFFLLIVASLLAFGVTKILEGKELFEGIRMKVFNPLAQLAPPMEKEEPAVEKFPIDMEEEPIDREEDISETVHQPSSSLVAKENKVQEQKALKQEVDKIPYGLTDYSEGGEALNKVRQALNEAGDRLVPIAFLGDSFIEGDILVGPFRNKLQSRYGGKGVGYVPLISNTARYRTTITHRFSGDWESTTSLKPMRGDRFTLAETFHYTTGGAEVTYEMAKTPQNLASVDRALLFYQTDTLSSYSVTVNNGEPKWYEAPYDSLTPTRLYVEHLGVGEQIAKVTLSFPNGFGGRLYGIYFDGATGVAVDNYSLRGSSGLQLASVSSGLTEQLSQFRTYDLIILSYGLNVASNDLEDTDDYGWYYAGMEKSLRHLKELYPNAVFLILSISDRATIDEGAVVSLPAVAKVLRHQQRLAKKYGCLFWNTYSVMQDKGGIEQFVENRWAAKDYTHMSYTGGRELANALLSDLLP